MPHAAVLELRPDPSDPLSNAGPVRWALAHLTSVVSTKAADCEGLGKLIVQIGGPDSATLAAAAAENRISLPEKQESFAVFRHGEVFCIWGRDARGLVYGLTEMADRVRYFAEGVLDADLPLVEEPNSSVRSISRLFSSIAEDRGWFHDKDMWERYLDMLVTNRYNRFALTLGLAYNYPYHNINITDVYLHFPYPYLLKIPGYDIDVAELSDVERSANFESLKFISDAAAKRGIDFQLGLWTQRYDFDDVPRANYTVRGVTSENLTPYCRAAVTKLLRECPGITGITFRIHVEGGIAEGNYEFWESLFAGMAEVGRPLEIDLHTKGLDFKTIDRARRSGLKLTVSPKYCAEHMSLPYHQSSIREKEYPITPKSEREQLSQGSRKFLRYSYGDLLKKDRDWKVIFRMWPGTQRVLLWGDPVLAAGYGRGATFAGADGLEWFDPLSYKGRQGSGVPGQRFNYKQQHLLTDFDWRKYEYQYRLIGRLAYAPDARPAAWERFLHHECADAREVCGSAVAAASAILPLITLTHGPAASNNYYWPENYTNLSMVPGSGTRPYGRDIIGEARFGNASTFDPQLFANPQEFVAALLAGKQDRRYTPLDVADWLEQRAEKAEAAILSAKAKTAYQRPVVQRMLIDAQIAAGIGRYFAEKYRSACWFELFLATKSQHLLTKAASLYRRAIMGWESAANASRDVYHDDLTFGQQAWMRGSWHTRLPEMRGELLEMEAMRTEGRTESVGLDATGSAAAKALRERTPTRSGGIDIKVTDSFIAGDDIVVTVPAPDTPGAEAPVLHYRHVNQAERWQATTMTRRADLYEGIIGGDYTQSDFHLQLYVTIRDDAGLTISPGLDTSLANEPYRVLLQA